MPTLNNLTAFEGIWIVVTFVALLIIGELYMRAREDLVAVLATKTNGGRLMTARSIRRRFLLTGIQITCLFIVAVIAGLVDRIVDDYRWIIPALLSVLASCMVLNVVLDNRDRSRIIDYIERLETRAKLGEVP